MIEEATTGRATCRGCRRVIAKGELRFGEEVPGNFDGMMTFWYHMMCAVEKKPEQLQRDLKRYKKIPNREEIEAMLGGATLAARTGRLKPVERAKTGRSKCKHCNSKIEKTTLRVPMTYEDAFMGTSFLHLACAAAFAGGDIDAQLIGKTAKMYRAETTAVLRSVKLIATDARGKQLVADAAGAKKPEAELSVLADWLEEQGCAISRIEVDQLLALHKKQARKKKR